MNFGGLAIADGVTVMNVIDVFSSPDWDTGKTVLFQTTYGEIFPLFPDGTAALQADEMREYLAQIYSTDDGWDRSTPKVLESAYSEEFRQKNPGYVMWSAFTSDVFFLIGNVDLAVRANQNWKKSKIYVGTVTYPPFKPFCLLNATFQIPIAFHLWDYMLASNNFTWITNQDCMNHPYSASDIDLVVGWAIRTQWRTLAYEGTFEGSGIDWPSPPWIGVISGIAVEPVHLDEFRNGVLGKLSRDPLNLNGTEFWFVN